MRIRNAILFYFLASFFFLSCTDDDDSITAQPIDTIVNCTTDFDNHVRAGMLQGLIDQYAREGFVGMNLLIDHPEEGVWMGSSGLSNLEENEMMDPCAMHHTASLYKMFVATIIMELIEEDAINIDDKIASYISSEIMDQIPNGEFITIKNLLQHRTGIPDIFEEEFLNDFFTDPTRSYAIEELLSYVYGKNPVSNVDAEFYYSDANYTLLTLLIEALEGDFSQSLDTRILGPLKLENTYLLTDPNQVPGNLANSYWNNFQDGSLENISAIQNILTSGLPGSDGIISNANDLKIFIQALVNGELVNDFASMKRFVGIPIEMQQSNVYNAYGIGLMNVNIGKDDWYGHFGNQIGSGAIVLYNEEKDITMVALQNTGTFFSADLQAKFFYQLLNDIENIIQ